MSKHLRGAACAPQDEEGVIFQWTYEVRERRRAATSSLAMNPLTPAEPPCPLIVVSGCRFSPSMSFTRGQLVAVKDAKTTRVGFARVVDITRRQLLIQYCTWKISAEGRKVHKWQETTSRIGNNRVIPTSQLTERERRILQSLRGDER